MSKKRIVWIAGGIASLVLLAALLAWVITWLPEEGPISVLEATKLPEPIIPDLIQPAPPDVAQVVMAATGFSLRTGIREAPLIDGGKATYLSLMLVSSGEFDTLTIHEHPVDVLYAYLLTKNGVMRLPVAVGFRDGENYYSLDGAAEAFSPQDREAVLTGLRQALPKGQTFDLGILRVSYKDGVDRSDCSRDWAPAWCSFAKEYNPSFGDTERQFVSKIITNRAWMPVGWLFAFYPAEDTTFSQTVALP